VLTQTSLLAIVQRCLPAVFAANIDRGGPPT
jgi:hypothetical protein